MVPAEVISLLRQTLSEETVSKIINYYIQTWETIPGAPHPSLLAADDVTALEIVSEFRLHLHTSWDLFKQSRAVSKLMDEDRSDPFMPDWYSKTDSSGSQWVTCVEYPKRMVETRRVALDAHIRRASPPRSMSLLDRLRTGLQVHEVYRKQVVAAISSNAREFMRVVGNVEQHGEAWTHGASLCFLAGLGLDSLRELADGLKLLDPYWARVAELDDIKLMEEILAGRTASGFPLGLIRVDFGDFQAIMQNVEGYPFAPWVYRAMAALHIIKYCRYVPLRGKQPAVYVCYRGRDSYLPVDISGVASSFNIGVNKTARTDLIGHLQLPTARDRWDAVACRSVIDRFRPVDLPRCAGMESQIELFPFTCVTSRSYRPENTVWSWVRSERAIGHLAHLNPSTGVVTPDVIVDDDRVLAFDWPRDTESDIPGAYEAWRGRLPAVVEAVWPAQLIRERFTNLDDLGHPQGLDALLNATLIIHLLRGGALSGSMFGDALPVEHPYITVLPTGAAMDEVTNNGKTTLALALAMIIVPGATVQTAPKMASAPMLRSALAPLQDTGIIVWDEWVTPTNPDSLLSANHLQTLATGGAITPGVAGGNARPVRLKYTMIFASKVCTDPPDLNNRNLYLFMGPIPPQGDGRRWTGAQQQEVASGAFSTKLMLQTRKLIHDGGIVALLRGLVPVSSPEFRFPAHITLARALCQDPGEIDAYLTRALACLQAQHAAAYEAGTVDSIGAAPKCHIGHFIDRMKEATKALLFMKPLGDHLLGEILSVIVENVGEESAQSALRGTRRSAAEGLLFDFLRSTPLVFNGRRLRAVDVGESDLISLTGKKIRAIRLETIST